MKHKSVIVFYYVVLIAAVLALDFSVEYESAFDLIIRGAAMSAIVLSFTAILSSLYLKELTRYFGVSFKTVHHTVALTALALMVIHPVSVAIRSGNIGVFVPVTSSVKAFFTNGGRVAIYLFLSGGIAAFGMKRLKKSWRYIHWLTYLGFFFAITHGIMYGINFEPIWMKIIGFTMMATVAAAFVRKRWMRRRTGTRRSQPG